MGVSRIISKWAHTSVVATKFTKQFTKLLAVAKRINKGFVSFLQSQTKQIKGVVHFGKKTVKEFYTLALAGKWKEAFKSSAKLTDTEIMHVAKEMEKSPIFSGERFLHFKKLAHEKCPKLKEAKNLEQVEKSIMSSSLSKLWKKIKNNWKKLIAYSGVIVVAGVGIEEIIKKHQESISGCLVYYNQGNTRKVCKQLSLTCIEGFKETRDIPGCADIYLTELQKTQNCAAMHEINQPCVHCDSHELNTTQLQYIGVDEDAEEHDDERDYFFACNNASFGDAFLDIVGGNVDDVLTSIKETGGLVNTLVTTVLHYLVYAVYVIFGVFVFFLIAKARHAFSNDNTQHYDDL